MKVSHIRFSRFSPRTPIITTAVGGNVEIIKNGENGILVSYDVLDTDKLLHSIISLLGDKEKASELAENGKKTIKDFSEERMLSSLSNTLKI